MYLSNLLPVLDWSSAVVIYSNGNIIFDGNTADAYGFFLDSGSCYEVKFITHESTDIKGRYIDLFIIKVS